MQTTRAPMLTLDEALARLLVAVAPLPASEHETLSTFDALGRVLQVDVRSTLDVPPADNTSMDGYAMRAADVPTIGTLLPVSQRIAAGTVGQPLQPGTAARIFTGAQVPPGADAVVMQEACEAVGEGVRVNVVPNIGQWIRRRGEDVRIGAVVLAAGTRLTPQALSGYEQTDCATAIRVVEGGGNTNPSNASSGSDCAGCVWDGSSCIWLSSSDWGAGAYSGGYTSCSSSCCRGH